jgi:penicillin amidase
MEPWYPLAFIRYNYYQQGFANDRALDRADLQTAAIDQRFKDNQGSNGWVIGPSRSASGKAMLFINPHLPFFGSGQVYEGHVHSDEGWNFTGYTRFGFPFPYVGHNDNGGWVSTDNGADLTDVYVETFDDPSRPLAYRYGSGYRTATEHIEEIIVKTPTGPERRKFRMVRTHHGPIVGERDGKKLSIRMAKFEDDGWLREWYLMTRAKTVAELKRAMAPLNMLFGNVMFADNQGGTFYLYNGAVPRRDPKFDWKKVRRRQRPGYRMEGLSHSRRTAAAYQSENRLDAELQRYAVSVDERRQSRSEKLSVLHGPGKRQSAERKLEKDPGGKQEIHV